MFPLRDNIPLARFPIVTVLLVAINVVAYLLAIRHGGSFLGGPSDAVAVHYGAIPYELAHPGEHCELLTAPASGDGSTVACQAAPFRAAQPGVSATVNGAPSTAETVPTSLFLHGSFLQIFGNMFFLAIFGPTIEDSLGRVRFLAFYLLGGLVGVAVQVAIEPSSTAPTLGSSGAVATVLGGYVLLYPRARIVGLVPLIFLATIVTVPAAVLLALWFPEQLYIALAGLGSPIGGGEGVAYLAHLGSFAFGLLAVRRLARPRARDRPLPVY
ncbi:MAG TPA: rhomboid family intramembrane serine protease [Solirubrobacteraceae bacterium]|nr:rhomboid family intramembrane serine protease [Solirubrobacteraceae bacterium]